MDWYGDSDAWQDAFQSLDGFDTTEELLATLFDRSSFDGVALQASDDACVQTPVGLNGLSSPATAQRASTNSSHDSTTETAPKKKKKKKQTVNTTKLTIERLRESVHEAECKLALLKSRQQQGSESPSAHGPVVYGPSATLWKDVATRQYRWRRESEVANERLRVACQEQEKVMQGLQRLILRSHAMLQSRTPMTIVPVDVEGTRYARRIHELMAVTSDMYMQVQLGMLPHNSIFAGSGTTPADPYNPVERVVPCRQEAVSSAVWSYLCRSAGETESYFRERIDASHDTVVKSFLVRWANETDTVNHRGIVVARRFPQHNGLDLIVYTAELESLQPSENPQSPVLAHGFRTSAWTIVRPSQSWSDHCEVIIRHVTNPFATLLTDAPPRSTTPEKTKKSMSQFARFAQLSLSRHLERVQRAIDGAFIYASDSQVGSQPGHESQNL